MTAQKFLRDFQQIFVEQKQKAEETYCSNKDFTEFVIKAINKIIADHKLENQKEYFQ